MQLIYRDQPVASRNEQEIFQTRTNPCYNKKEFRNSVEILAGTSKYVVFGGRGPGSPRQGPFPDARRRPGLRQSATPRDKRASGMEKGKELESCEAKWTRSSIPKKGFGPLGC